MLSVHHNSLLNVHNAALTILIAINTVAISFRMLQVFPSVGPFIVDAKDDFLRFLSNVRLVVLSTAGSIVQLLRDMLLHN